MSEATIRAAIKTVVDAVTDIGEVYDYERWTNNWDDYLNIFKTTISGKTQIRGWTIGYAGFTAEYIAHGDTTGDRHQRFIVRGYLGLDDSAATEKTAAALAESVCDGLDAAATMDLFTPCQLEVFETRMFGSVLCHYAEINCTVTEYVS